MGYVKVQKVHFVSVDGSLWIIYEKKVHFLIGLNQMIYIIDKYTMIVSTVEIQYIDVLFRVPSLKRTIATY